jgi:hypothetical protein
MHFQNTLAFVMASMQECFNLAELTFINDIYYNSDMVNGARFFTYPRLDWQRRYEALRASFVERLPAFAVAKRFAYAPAYVNLLRHQFSQGKIDFSEPNPEGKAHRYRVSNEMRQKIKAWRENNMSAAEIAHSLSDEGHEVSIRTIERVLREEGYKKLPRRSLLKIGMTVKGATIPDKAQTITLADLEGHRFISDRAGIFLFAPFISQFDFDRIVQRAGLPGSKVVPAKSYLLSFLSLKLLGMERYSHAADYSFDPVMGASAGLGVLPKCTALSTYSYSLDEVHIQRLQQEFVTQVQQLHLYDGTYVNLDFHTIPHYGDDSVLEKHWAGARNKTMKGVLTLIAQDAESKLLLYTATDIKRIEANDQVHSFMSYWSKVNRGVKPTLVFDSKFTEYENLSKLNEQNLRFITLRRRGDDLIEKAKSITDWKRITIPNPKRKFPHPYVNESTISLRNYDGDLRQVIIRGNGREKPAFLITNDFKTPLDLLVGTYARRWRVENGIGEAVKFFHLNSLSSSILIKVHFDVVMTMIADTLYDMLAKQLRGFEDCNAQTIYRHFVQGKGTVSVEEGHLSVVYPRRAHNPVLRAVPWNNMPMVLPGFGSKFSMSFM